MDLSRYYKSYFICVLMMHVGYFLVSYLIDLPNMGTLVLIGSLVMITVVISQFLVEQKRVPEVSEKYKLAKVFSLISFIFSVLEVVIGFLFVDQEDIQELLQNHIFIFILIGTIVFITAVTYGVTLLACGKQAEKKLKKILAAS